MDREARVKRQVSTIPKATGQSELELQMDGELWLSRRLILHGVDLHAGTTDTNLRKDRAREAIKSHGLECVICGRGPDSKPNTYAQAFERLYGEKL